MQNKSFKGWAIGDVVHGPKLIRKAKKKTALLPGALRAHTKHVDSGTSVSVINTQVMLAKTGTLLFLTNCPAYIQRQTMSVSKILTNAINSKVFGTHIIDPLAGKLTAKDCIT
jgi:pyruvate/2-oxoglutarate dehydrogenase complex dihydrolipoamide dehydrogenase (E3) component